jgi:hypothetical protein
MGSILLAHSASAEEGAAPAAAADSRAGPAAALEPEVAPVSAASGAPAAASTTWDEPPEQPAAAPHTVPPRERWYGWQILVSDLASITLGVATEQELVFGVGYVVAPPLIHLFHGQGTHALASAGMRIGLPLLGYAIAVEGARGCSDPGFVPSFCGLGAFVVGFIVGVSAVGIDPAFAYEPLEPTERAHSSFAPQISISHRQARFGLVGSF